MSRIKVGLTSRTLSGNNMRDILAHIINTHIEIIDDLIQDAYIAGQTGIMYELPFTFDIGNLSGDDARILVYSELISLMRRPTDQGGKGFDDTFITLNKKSTVLTVKWRSIFSAEEKKARRDIIDSAKLSNLPKRTPDSQPIRR